MRRLILITVILAIPIVPFIGFHATLERWLLRLGESSPDPWTLAVVVMGLLATDVFLPIPSSFVSTLAGGQLPPFVAAAASWVGLNAGAAIGFGASRIWGRPLAERLSNPEDLRRMQRFTDRYATTALVVTRALPILAEATVLLLGTQQLTWRRFWPPILLSNLGIAVAYSWLGHIARDQEWLPFAMSISVALPLLATWGLQRRWSVGATSE